MSAGVSNGKMRASTSCSAPLSSRTEKPGLIEQLVMRGDAREGLGRRDRAAAPLELAERGRVNADLGRNPPLLAVLEERDLALGASHWQSPHLAPTPTFGAGGSTQ